MPLDSLFKTLPSRIRIAILVMIVLAGLSHFAIPVRGETRDQEPSKAEEVAQKVEEAQQAVEAKLDKVEDARQAAEAVLAQKEILAKETQIKQQEAELTKQEAQTLQEEAKITKDSAVAKEAKLLKKKASRLEQEAAQQESKLKLMEGKARLAQERVALHEASMQALREEVKRLKKEKATHTEWQDKVIASCLSIALGLIFFILLRMGIRKLEKILSTDYQKESVRESDTVLRLKTLGKLAYWLGNVLIVGIVLYTLLEIFGIDVTPLLAGAGIMGLAFGFGGQYLIRDIINGIFILLEGQYRIHDVVRIGEHGGLVSDVTLRTTTLRNLEGKVIVIPNGEIKTVVNYTMEFSQAVLEIGVAYKENVDRVMDVIRQIGAEFRKAPHFGTLVTADMEMLGVEEFAASQVTIKFRMRTLPMKQWEVARELRRRIKNRFDELGIEIPFPHTTLYMGTGKENDWLRQLAVKISTEK